MRMDTFQTGENQKTPVPLSEGNPSSSRFWPLRPNHIVHSMKLASPTQPFSDRALQIMRQIVHISDAIRGLQNLEGMDHENNGHETTANEKRSLEETSARLLLSLAETIECKDSAEALRLRAMMLRHGMTRDISEKTMRLDEKQLIAICGNLGTWHGKSKKIFHSALFASIDDHYTGLMAVFDSTLTPICQYLKNTVYPHLELKAPPSMKVGNLMFCGGEANMYPKHFAYFLPEDEGIKYSQVKKTLVFANTYFEMYEKISRRYGAQYVSMDVSDANISRETEHDQLMLWFRGHDIGHGVYLPETDYRILRKQGRWVSMVLQEVLADTFGFIVSTEGPITDVVDKVSISAASRIFMHEMLRYLRRGGDDFPDAGAALFELSYLVFNGYVDVDERRRIVVVSESGLQDGMHALARTLVKTVLSNDVEQTTDLVEKYYTNGCRAFVDLLGSCEAVLEYT